MFKSRIKKWRLEKSRKVGFPSFEHSVLNRRTESTIIQSADLSSVSSKDVGRDAKGRGLMNSIQGHRRDIEFAFAYFSRKSDGSPAQVAQSMSVEHDRQTEFLPRVDDKLPPAVSISLHGLARANDTQSYQPETPSPQASGAAFLAKNPKLHGQILRGKPPLTLPALDDILGHRPIPGNPSVISAFTSFHDWYCYYHEAFNKDNREQIETLYLLSSPTHGLAPPTEFQIMENLIRSARDFETISMPNVRERSYSFVRATVESRTSLACGLYDRALLHYKQAAEMVPDLFSKIRPSLLIDMVYTSIKDMPKLAVEYMVLPMMTQMLKASVFLHGSRHPLSRGILWLLTTYRLGLSPAFRAHLLILHLKHTLGNFLAYLNDINIDSLNKTIEVSDRLMQLAMYVEAVEYLEQRPPSQDLAQMMPPFRSCRDIARIAEHWELANLFNGRAHALNGAGVQASALSPHQFTGLRFIVLRECARSLRLQGRNREAMEKERARWKHASADFGIEDWKTIDSKRGYEDLSVQIARQGRSSEEHQHYCAETA